MTDSPLTRKNRILSALAVCGAACALTLAMLAVVYAVRGIWPFGMDNVAYMDTAQFYIPDYYRTWDSLHGLTATGVNWFEGLGKLSGSSWKALLYPYNWAFMLVSRDHILEGLSLYLAIRMVILALFAALAVSLRFPRLRVSWRVVFALIYTFSGYVLQYYSNFQWFNTVTLFPLLLVGLERLLRDGKCLLYLLLCYYYLSRGVYFSYMLVIFILLFSLGYCLFLLDKQQRGDRIFRLGAYTALAWLLNFRKVQSSAAGLAGTNRFQENLDTGILKGMTTWDIANTRHTFLMLLGTALLLALLLRTIRTASPARRERIRPAVRFFWYLAAVFAIPMVFTNIDTAWHFGQYSFFPMRYGFVLPATLIGFAGSALELGEEPPAAAALPAGRKGGRIALALAAAAALALGLPLVLSRFREYGACFLNVTGAGDYLPYLGALILCGIAYTALYYLLTGLPRRRAAALALGLAVLQLGANAGGLIAPDDDHTVRHEYDPAYIEAADSLHAYFSDQDISPLSRAKNVDSSMSGGYPAIAGVSALSTVDSNNSAAFLGLFRELGYTVNYCRVADVGGTVFSDMLLGVDRALSQLPLDESLYQSVDTVDGMHVGAARYPGALGLTYDPAALEEYFDLETIPDRLNALYRAFTGSREALARPLTPEIAAEGKGLRRYTLACPLDSESFLYVAGDSFMTDITAGGRSVPVPTYQNLTNRIYPAMFNSGLLYLGQFPAGTAEISFSSAMDIAAEDLELIALDKSLLDGFYAAAGVDKAPEMTYDEDSLTITVTAAEGESLFLPLAGKWTCTVNGRDVPQESFLGAMLSVPLQAGENTVTVARQGGSRTPVFTLPRISGSNALSVLCLALLALWLLLRRTSPRVRALTVPKWLGSTALAAFYMVVAAVAGFVYLAPTVLLLCRGTVIWF